MGIGQGLLLKEDGEILVTKFESGGKWMKRNLNRVNMIQKIPSKEQNTLVEFLDFFEGPT
jgi:hypothetical protein